ncbi:hypothetical protein KIPB_007880 [Kipferlia bialata]|uniref:Uncharacterized protein n=1 Tax=Kipferlia bialata TaxID=797122 RepID=A0A9K3CZ74_9EUKA|nr:hypothetical protein KIPB_007880 [Kipferlia bialata]|eukprot:g7880.t1
MCLKGSTTEFYYASNRMSGGYGDLASADDYCAPWEGETLSMYAVSADMTGQDVNAVTPTQYEETCDNGSLYKNGGLLIMVAGCPIIAIGAIVCKVQLKNQKADGNEPQPLPLPQQPSQAQVNANFTVPPVQTQPPVSQGYGQPTLQ